MGFFTKGILYLTLGGLAAQQAILGGGQVGGSKGAIRQMGEQPFGDVLLYVVTVGLVGYALWKLLSAVLDPERVGTDAKGIGKRIGYFASGLLHGSLAYATFQLASGQGGGGSSKQSWIATVMQQPGGQIAVGVVGGAIAIAAIMQIKKGFTQKFRRQIRIYTMSHTTERATLFLGKAGHIARGVVFGVISYFVIDAAATYDPSQAAKGVGGALREIASQPYGMVLLAVVSLGLAAYGAYMLLASRYRYIPAPRR